MQSYNHFTANTNIGVKDFSTPVTTKHQGLGGT